MSRQHAIIAYNMDDEREREQGDSGRVVMLLKALFFLNQHRLALKECHNESDVF